MAQFVAMLLILVSSSLLAAPILILGDSLSAAYGIPENEGWVNLLRQKLPQHTLINGSVSGETSAGALRRLPALLDSAAPELVFIELGGNDGLRGFPTQQLERNLTQIIKLSQERGALILLSEIMIPPNYGSRYAKQFTQVYQDIAKKQQVTLVPFFMQDIVTNADLMQNDSIHPNAKAQPQIASFIQPWLLGEL
ncbi:arylesterase [Shewanella surugensis]|uniref:Arylesterase n=1 Tax=Shewanella surugensis TaxID=212020 RepID=A0ABT0LF52_9GAMM|nr:arylesterase [Shewanella surugensis]MCL1126290.1 arylesterase [Shewanella surugensis]